MPHNWCQDASFHKSRSLHQASAGQKRRPTHCSSVRGLALLSQILWFSNRLEHCLYPIKTRTERKEGLICDPLWQGMRSLTSFQSCLFSSLVLPHNHLHALVILTVKYVWTHLVMGQPGYWSSEYYDFFPKTIKWQRKVKETSFSCIHLSFLCVHRWARYLFLPSWSCSTPMAVGKQQTQFQHSSTNQSYWR